MKKGIALLALAILMTAGMAMDAAAADRPRLDVTLLSYTPVPAEPGSYVTVTLKMENKGDASAKDATLEFVDNYPFSLDDEPERMKDIGELSPGADYLAEYRVRVDSAAVEGTNYLKIRYNTDSASGNWVEKDIPLTVNTVQKTLSVNSVEMEPEAVAPGSRMDVDIKVKNLASGHVRNVGVKLELAQVSANGQTYDIPLAPIGSSVEKRIALLQGGETADFGFVLQAYPEAAAGIYKVPVTISYTDENGNDQSRQDLVSVTVNDEPDLMTVIDRSTIYSDDAQGEVTVSITNKGFSELKFLTVTLGESGSYDILSAADEIYLGNVDSDDYETATFKLRTHTEGADVVTLPVTLTFKDAMNNEYEVEKNLTLELISSADAGNENSSTGTVITVLVVLAIVGFIIVRRRKCKRRKQ